MKRSNAILISALVILALLTGGLYLFVVRPRLGPIDIGPITIITPERPTEPEERHAGLNLYFHAPLRLSGIARMELTLLAIEAIDGNGKRYPVAEGVRRITIQENVVQKIGSEAIIPGRLDRVVLTFGPTARITMPDQSAETVALPKRELGVVIGADVPTSRTMNVLVPLPKSTAFGEENGVLTLELPASTDAEHALLGGFTISERSIGEIYSIADATIRDAILEDIGLDIAPREGPRGSTGFGAPDEAQPNVESEE